MSELKDSGKRGEIVISTVHYSTPHAYISPRGLVGTTHTHLVGICEFESQQKFIFLLISVAESVRT